MAEQTINAISEMLDYFKEGFLKINFRNELDDIMH